MLRFELTEATDIHRIAGGYGFAYRLEEAV